jgi:transposase
MNILAMDLGKNKTVFCEYDSKTAVHKFGKVKTSPQQIHDVLVEKAPDKIVIEICSAAGWIYDIAKALGLETEVANPSHQGWRWKKLKRKTDRTDALKLAQLSAMKQLPLVHVPDKAVRQKRSLIGYRRKLVERRTQIKNSIRAILDREGLPMPAGKAGWSQSAIKKLKSMAVPISEINNDCLWRGQLWMELLQLEHIEHCLAEVTSALDSLGKENADVQRLQSIPGVGPRLSEAIVAYLDNPGRFDNGKKVGSYAGLTPKQYQSGSMDRQGKISGCGNVLLRSLLVEVSWSGIRYNRCMRETYKRVFRGSPSRKKIAITAVARKLLVRCWAMLRDEQIWHDEIISEAA